jgi:hypothetical protein
LLAIYLSSSHINKFLATPWTTAAILDFVVFYLNTNISETIEQNSIFFFAMFFLIKYLYKKLI